MNLKLNSGTVTWQKSKVHELCSRGRKTTVLQSWRGGQERAPLDKPGWEPYEALVHSRVFRQIVCPTWFAGVLAFPGYFSEVLPGFKGVNRH